MATVIDTIVTAEKEGGDRMDDNNVQKIDLMQYVDRFWRTLTRFKLILFLLFLLIVAFFVGQEVLFFDTTYSSTAVFVDQSGGRGAVQFW